jgi:adenylate kinase family enzyme
LKHFLALFIGPATCRPGAILGIDVIHLDRVHWRPGWIEPPEQEFRADVSEIVARDRWVIDGNYGRTQALTLPRADTIVWLDFPMPLCMWRIVARLIEYSGVSRPDLPAGCPETPDWEFTRWVWNFPKNERPKIVEKPSWTSRSRGRTFWVATSSVNASTHSRVPPRSMKGARVSDVTISRWRSRSGG